MSNKFTGMLKEETLDPLILISWHLPVSSGNNHEEIFVMLGVQSEIRKTEHPQIPWALQLELSCFVH